MIMIGKDTSTNRLKFAANILKKHQYIDSFHYNFRSDQAEDDDSGMYMCFQNVLRNKDFKHMSYW